MLRPRLAAAASFAGFLFAAGSFAWAWVYPLSTYGRSVAPTCGVVIVIEFVTLWFLLLSEPSDEDDDGLLRPGRVRALARVLVLAGFAGLMISLAREPGVVLSGVAALAALLPNHFMLQWREPQELRREAMAALFCFFTPLLVLLFAEPPRLGISLDVERELFAHPANGVHLFFALATAYFSLRALWAFTELVRTRA